MTDNNLHRIIDLALFLRDKAPKVTVDMLGIDADTTSEELDNIERWFFGLDKFQKETLFATLEAFPACDVEELSERVDDVLAGRWIVYDKIRTVAELGYWLTHDASEFAEEGDDLDNPRAIRLAKEVLADETHWRVGALVPGRGYVSCTES